MSYLSKTHAVARTIMVVAFVLSAVLLCFAESGEIASGNFNGADWRITSSGELIIGKEGQSQDMKCEGWAPWNSADDSGKSLYKSILSVRVDGIVRASGYANYLFSNLYNAGSFDLAGLDTSGIYSMRNMFDSCQSVESLDLSSFDTSNTRDFDCMFANCIHLRNIDTSSFRIQGSMEEMFSECRELEELDLSGCDFTDIGVYSSYGLFKEVKKLERIKTPIMFHNVVSLPYPMYSRSGNEYNNLPVNYNRSITLYKDKEEALAAKGSEINDISGTFCGVDWKIDRDDILVIGKRGETQQFRVDRDFSKDDIFWPWKDYSNSVLEVRFEGTVRAGLSLARMFEDFANVESIDFTGLDTSNAVSMRCMFANCGANNLDLSGFNTKKVTDMWFMFYGCSNLEKLNLSSFNTSEVTDMGGMFGSCESLTELDLSGFSTSKVTDMSGMFGACRSLTELNLSSFNTSEVTDMGGMFESCESLTELDLSSFDTVNMTDWMGMLNNCIRLKKLDISSFNTKKTKTGIHHIFKGDSDGEDYDEPDPYVFGGCSALRYIALGKNTVVKNETLEHDRWIRFKSLDGGRISKKSFYNLDEYTGKYPGWYKLSTKELTVKTVEINTTRVTVKAIDEAISEKGGFADDVTTIVLGKKVKRISTGAFKKLSKAKTLVIETKQLTRKGVKGSLKGSNIKTIHVKVGTNKLNETYLKKYKNYFSKRNAGKKISIKCIKESTVKINTAEVTNKVLHEAISKEGSFVDDVTTIILGKNVKTIKKNALKGSKATKLIVKTKLLKKSKVKGCLKGSKIKTVQVKVSTKKSVNNKYVKSYKKIFTKANTGRKVTVEYHY